MWSVKFLLGRRGKKEKRALRVVGYGIEANVDCLRRRKLRVPKRRMRNGTFNLPSHPPSSFVPSAGNMSFRIFGVLYRGSYCWWLLFFFWQQEREIWRRGSESHPGDRRCEPERLWVFENLHREGREFINLEIGKGAGGLGKLGDDDYISPHGNLGHGFGNIGGKRDVHY